MLAIPYESLGLDKETASFNRLSFKWLDNFGRDATVEDLYLTGDVAPESRFFFNATE